MTKLNGLSPLESEFFYNNKKKNLYLHVETCALKLRNIPTTLSTIKAPLLLLWKERMRTFMQLEIENRARDAVASKTAV
jgi:hypothetical protein